MKKILLALAAVATIFAGCTKGFEERLSNLENRVSELESFVTNLNIQVEGIQAIVSNLQKNVYVTSVEDIKNDSQVVIGYKLTFNQGNPIEIYHGVNGEKGDKGDPGINPTIDFYDPNPEDDIQGDWYWKLAGGDWITDGSGNKIPVYKSLEFEVIDGHLFLKVDGSMSIDLGLVQGEKGDSMFDGVDVNEEAGTVTIDLKGTDTDLVLPLAGFNIVFDLSEVKGYMENQPVNIPYSFVGGAKVSEVTVRVLKSENCQVEIDKYNQVVKITPNAGEGYVDLYAIYNPTGNPGGGELRAKTISFNADNYFEITNSVYAVSPVGGNVEVPVITSAEYDLEIDGDWLTYTETKAIRTETIVLTAGANETGADRTATVTLRLKGDTKVLGTFEVTQKLLNTELVGKKYVENYTKSFQAYSGTLEFMLSDDFSKGVYKVTICGVTVYADVEGTTLTIYDGKNPRTLTFSDDYSTVTGPAQLSFNNSTIQNYKAFMPLGPAELTEAEAALVGTYDESWKHNGSAAGVAGGMVISASEEASYGQLKVRFLNDGGSYYESYTSLVDGTLTLEIGGQSHPKYNSPSFAPTCQVTLTVNADGTITLASHTMLYGLANYVATKVVEQEGGDEPEEGGALAGTWTVVYESTDNLYSDNGTWTSQTGTLKIEGTAGAYKITNFLGKSVSWALTESGNTLSYSASGLELSFTYDETSGELRTATGKTITDYMSFRIRSIVATKEAANVGGEGGEAALDFAGTWNVSCEMGDVYGMQAPAPTTGTMVITGSGENYVIQSIAGVNYGLSVVWNGSALTGGKNSATMTLVYDEANDTLTFTGEYKDYEHNFVKNIVATR